jgi:hypothetical protein
MFHHQPPWCGGSARHSQQFAQNIPAARAESDSQIDFRTIAGG